MIVVVLALIRLVAPNIFLHLTTPLLQSGAAVAASSHTFFSQFGERAELTRKYEQLQEENAALGSENEALIQKIASLESLLGPSGGTHLAQANSIAGVLSRPPETPYDTLIVDKGTKAGVRVGQEAFGSGHVPIGVVSAVTSDFARVTLFSAPGMSVSARLGIHELPFTLTGAGGGALTGVVTRSTQFAVGDTVFVDGPGAEPVGKVVRIDDDPTAPSVTLQIQPAVNLFSLSWVALYDSGVLLTAVSATSTKP